MTLEIIAVALGLLVGLSMGALGGGGSTMAIPILVFVAGMTVPQATTAALLVVGLAAAFGAQRHWRNGYVRLGAGVAFGLAGIAGASVGTALNRSLDEQLLLLAFSALVLFIAARMYRASVELPGAPATPPVGPSRHLGSDDESALITAPHKVAARVTPRSMATLAAAATGVGLLTGLFGVGGGFAIVPALSLFLGFRMKEAIGTSLVVIAINASLALALRAPDLEFRWVVVLPFLATVTIGVLVGSHLAERMPAARLGRAFALLLALVATYTALSTLLG